MIKLFCEQLHTLESMRFTHSCMLVVWAHTNKQRGKQKMKINKDLVNSINSLIKEKKAMIREIKKVHGLIHPAVSVAQKELASIESSLSNYIMQVNMFNLGAIYSSAEAFAKKEEVKLNAALGVTI